MRVFYRINYAEFYNGSKICGQDGVIRYGELPNVYEEKVYNNYQEFLNALENQEVESDFFYVDNIPIIDQKYLAHNSWSEVVRYHEKEFKSYASKKYAEKMLTEPSLNTVIQSLPVNELLDWCKDNNISVENLIK